MGNNDYDLSGLAPLFMIPRMAFGVGFCLFLFIGTCNHIHQKQKEHTYKLKNDSEYAQKSDEKIHPFKMRESKKGIELKLVRIGTIRGLDYNKDGIVDEAHEWVGGRCGVVKMKYDANDSNYKELQRRYSRALKAKNR